jgi:hypothetical protein
MLTVAVLMPELVGVRVITKLLPPVVISVEGEVVTLNCPPLGPVKEMEWIVNDPLPPAFEMEKVAEVFVPKSVLLVVEVVVPKGMLLPFPDTLMVEVGGVTTVYPLATPPGLTQLEVLPVKANAFSVPLIALAEASVSTVEVELLNPATP